MSCRADSGHWDGKTITDIWPLKWYKDTRHHIVPVQIDGCPEEEREVLPASCAPSVAPAPSSRAVRIMIDIHISNGMHIQQRNLKINAFDKFFALLKTEKAEK